MGRKTHDKGMNVNIIHSGSSGNTASIDDFLIIDVGWPEVPKGEHVLLTHNHTDHTKCLDKVGGLPTYCTPETADRLAQKWPFLAFSSLTPGDVKVLCSNEFQYTIKIIPLRHDVPCVGFEIQRCARSEYAEPQTILWLTDFNEIVDEKYIIRALRDKRFDHIYIECNNTLSTGDMMDLFFTDEVPRDEFHRRKSYQNHCNVEYLIGLFTRAGYTPDRRYELPVTLLHKSSYYYLNHSERIVELCKLANVINPLI